MPLFIRPLIVAGILFYLAAQSSLTSGEGYLLPWSGNASTTQFSLGPELSAGTSCGVQAWAGNMSYGTPPAGGGPGFLYAAMNQLAFGANPSGTRFESSPDEQCFDWKILTDPHGGGPGAACGLCYKVTPISGGGLLLDKQALTFKIIDECPAEVDPTAPNSGPSLHCGMCSLGQLNDFGQQWHFDIAVDAMNKDQYDTFFGNVTDGKYVAVPCSILRRLLIVESKIDASRLVMC